MKRLVFLILNVFALLTGWAQTTADSVKMPNVAFGGRGLNLGVIGRADTLKGLQLNLLSSSADLLKGVQIGAVVGAADNLSGVQWAALSTVSRRFKGFQLSSMNNVALSPYRGWQIAGVSNVAMGVERGMQLSAANISASYMRGAQIGVYNYADTLNGSQLGLVNVALSHPRGWQVGVVNYTRDTIAHKIGLVNVNPKTRIDLMSFGGTSSKANLAVRFRNRSTYNIIGVGTHYMGLDEHFSGALFYRIGQYFQLSPRWSVSGDIGFFHIETFEENSAETPERLYSVQAHLNADYQLSRAVGLYGSVGYEQTRYYSPNRKYRNGLVAQLGLTFLLPRDNDKSADELLQEAARRSNQKRSDLLSTTSDGKHPWRAAAQVTAINALVHCFDRFVLDEEFAQVNLHTIHRNLKKGFVWDNDQFSTNLFAHPYHGNLYFNAARSNGLNFWESAPYAMGGSLMWELFGEIEPPAINDLIATTFGGISLGEVTFRLSDIVLDDRTHGFPRFLREAAATLISPLKGFNRIVSGRAWRVNPAAAPYHDHDALPVNLTITVGDRYVADNGALFRGEQQPSIDFGIEYGDILDEENNRPYDFFALNATFGFTGNQPIISNLHLLGRLWSARTVSTSRLSAEFGLYQHFNYYDSKPVKNGSDRTPFRISEAASFGPGFVFRYHDIGSLRQLEQRFLLSAILLGGTKSDYYNIIDRDYNMGSGYSAKVQTRMKYRNLCDVRLLAEHYRIFTWKGYEGKDLETIDPLYLNSQGDRGNAQLTVATAMLDFPLNDHLTIKSQASYFIRDTHYKYYDDVSSRTFEVRLGLAYTF